MHRLPLVWSSSNDAHVAFGQPFWSPEHSKGLWRCQIETLLCSLISPCDTAHDQTTKQWVQEFQVGYWLAWMPLSFKIAIYTQRQHTAEYIQYKCDTLSFGATREIRTRQERTDWGRTESAVDCEIKKKDAGGTVMKLTYVSTGSEEKLTHWWGDSTQVRTKRIYT